jgi:hypothetical protein
MLLDEEIEREFVEREGSQVDDSCGALSIYLMPFRAALLGLKRRI